MDGCSVVMFVARGRFSRVSLAPDVIWLTPRGIPVISLQPCSGSCGFCRCCDHAGNYNIHEGHVPPPLPFCKGVPSVTRPRELTLLEEWDLILT